MVSSNAQETFKNTRDGIANKCINKSDIQGKRKVFKALVTIGSVPCFGKEDKILHKPCITIDIMNIIKERRRFKISRDEIGYLVSRPVSYTHLDVYKRQGMRAHERSWFLCENRHTHRSRYCTC